jgi:genome maintenance exonuclease 1
LPLPTIEFDWLETSELEQINEPTGRKYKTPEGNLYQSVTSFLGSFSDGSIEKWKEAVGEAEANRVSKRATTRGSLLHENVENYLLNHTIHIPKTSFLAIDTFKKFIPELQKISNIRLLEDRLYSDILKLAGTVDCVAEYNGVLSVVDFKTANDLKDKYAIESYFLQTTIYSLMIQELFGLTIKQLVVMIAVDGQSPQVFIENRSNWIKKLRELIEVRDASL